jgi:two-component system chemotaxis sensor kinase CheA
MPVPMEQSLFDELDTEPERRRGFTIRFRPKPALYAKANETALLLRELARLGETSVVCDSSGLPTLSDLDPEGGYLTWIISLQTTLPEAAIRDVFEFVETDCDLDIESADRDAPPAELDMPVLIEKMQAAVEAKRADRAAPPSAPAPPAADHAARVVGAKPDPGPSRPRPRRRGDRRGGGSA